jgi:Sulfotransferase family
MNTEMVYIVGLGRSGTTLLDLLLGCHPSLVGLGEVFHFTMPNSRRLSQSSEIMCSCGQSMDQCLFWGPTTVALRKANDKSASEKYSIVFDHFSQTFGNKVIPIDSSKNLEALQVLRTKSDENIKLIFMIRDVRGWTTSIRSLSNDTKSWLLPLKKLSLWQFLHWYSDNLAIIRFLKDENLPFFQLGYEELALYPLRTLKKLCDFLEIDYNLTNWKLSDSKSHNVLGNRMRIDKGGKKEKIYYDNRWFVSKDWLLSSMLLYPVMKFNSREVYGNIVHPFSIR